MVQAVAAQRLFQGGVMVKDGSALERLAEVDHVVLDKTGTLTRGVPRLIESGTIAPGALAIAASMASGSRHPYSQAIVAAGRRSNALIVAPEDLREYPGEGVEARMSGKLYRFGRSDWAIAGGVRRAGVVLSEDGTLLESFLFVDELRPAAREAVVALTAKGIRVEIVSGDHDEPVSRLASLLKIPYRAAVTPAGKVSHIATLAAAGAKVLMVGDGLNDAPALGAAHVSMAPASAADIGRNAADLVFLRDSLLAVPDAIDTACRARDLVRQNFVLAAGYNALAVPIAIMGQVTPLVAAIAMSASSVAVVGNALRLGSRPGKKTKASLKDATPPSIQALTGAAR
jgi:Cu2+-exporting ATPase